MKVLKEVALTEDEKEDSKTVSTLSVGEAVEVVHEKGARIQAKRVSDGTEGWITVESNLEECSGCFRVVKETILTDNFDLTDRKEATRSVHVVNKKLPVGELVEVREWP